MADILPFPTLSAPNRPPAAPTPAAVHRPLLSRTVHGGLPLPAPRIDVAARRFMPFAELAERVGLAGRDPRTITAHLRLLHDQAGMPAPRLPRKRDGRLLYGADAIWSGAQWDRGSILIWLDRPIGPGGAALPAAAPPVHVEVAAAEIDRLAARAAMMLGGQLKRAGA